MVPATIRSRLIALVIAAAFPAFVVLVWMFSEEVRREHTAALDLALRISRSVAADIASSNVTGEALLQRMTERPKIVRADAGDCDSLFAIVDFFPQYLDLVRYDLGGRPLCGASPAPADAEISSFAERRIPEYLRLHQRNLSDPLMVQHRGRWVAILFRQVVEQGKLVGYLALIQNLDFNADAYPPGTVVTVLDGKGILVARSQEPEKYVGSKARNTPIRRRMLRELEGREEAVGLDGVRRQYGFTHIGNTGWIVSTGVPAGVAMASVRSLILRGAAAGTFIVGAVLLFAIRLSRSIGRPLGELTHAARRVANEGYGGLVPAEGPFELVGLGEAFNQMVRKRSEAEQALIESREQLEALSNRLLHVQEDERTRIAREIHDELGQLLTALNMDVGGLLDSVEPLRVSQAAMGQRIRRVVAQMLDSVQRIASELRPAALDDFGLTAAIESEVRAFEARTGIECELSIDADDLTLSHDGDAAIYRILQEALTNVARHSDAGRVEIRARLRESELLVEIRDDGRGIDDVALNNRHSLGLLGMRERARSIDATIEIEGVPGRGTIVSVRVPLPAGVRKVGT